MIKVSTATLIEEEFNLLFARAVQNEILHTPSTRVGILDGVTRGAIIEQALEHRMEVHEGEYTLDRLMDADEVFITNTTTEVMPVSEIDGKTFKIGPMARRLREMYQTLINTEEDDYAS